MVEKLSDDESKKIFESAVKFRCTHDINDRPPYCRMDQYFSADLIRPMIGEVFVDCGAFNGDTIRSFQKKYKEIYKEIIAFEPDEDTVELIKKLCPFERLTVISAATWNEDTTLFFETGKGSSSKVKAFGEKSVDAKAIDLVEQCKNVTFLKMDIEGSEYNTLLGAYETIKRNKPTMAICIYHSHEDMLRLFELIDSWNLGYNYYVRHHGQKISETVLYCIQPERCNS